MSNGTLVVPASAPSPDPNAWATLVDYLKTIVTLASGLLALTVTFASSLLKESADPASWALMFAWGFLFASTFGAVLGIALCVEYLRNGKSGKSSILWANVSFFALLIGVGGLGVAGYLSLDKRELTPTDAIAEALDLVRKQNPQVQDVLLESLTQRPGAEFQLRITDKAKSLAYEIEMKGRPGNVTKMKRL